MTDSHKESAYEKMPDFLIIPTVLVWDNNIRHGDAVVWAIIYWMTGFSLKKCFASNAKIAKYCNTTPNTVAQSLLRLHRGGYIEIKHDEVGKRIEIIPTITFGYSRSGNKGRYQKVTPSSPSGNDNNNNIKINTSKSKDLEGSGQNTDTPFDLKHEIEKLQNDKRKHIQLIGAYIEERGLQPRNKYQLQQIILRHTKAAAKVAKFDEDQIQKAYKIANKEYDAWTLETLLKVLSRDKI